MDVSSGEHRRGQGTGRLEALSDAVFAFSATLLVVSLEVPKTFAELTASLAGFVAFGFSFALLMMIWTAHHGFFKRYALEDVGTIAINSVLLFLVLFYVYPLKFMTSMVTGWHLGLEDVRDMIEGKSDVMQLLLIYSAGFIAVYLCFVLLYATALKKRRQLGLDELEIFDGRMMMRHYAIYIGVGVLSIALTLADVGLTIGLPGWIYALIGPLCASHSVWSERRRAVLEQRLAPSSD